MRRHKAAALTVAFPTMMLLRRRSSNRTRNHSSPALPEFALPYYLRAFVGTALASVIWYSLYALYALDAAAIAAKTTIHVSLSLIHRGMYLPFSHARKQSIARVLAATAALRLRRSLPAARVGARWERPATSPRPPEDGWCRRGK